VLGEEGPGEVDQVRDRLVGGGGPPGTQTKYYSNTTRFDHVTESTRGKRESKAANSDSFEFTSWWVEAGRVRVVLGLGAVGDDEDLDVAEQAGARPEGGPLGAAACPSARPSTRSTATSVTPSGRAPACSATSRSSSSPPAPRREGVTLVAVDLVEGLADGHAAALELDMHQRQAVDADRVGRRHLQ